MTTNYLLLGDVSRLLGVKPYRVNYAIVNNLVEEPALRIANRRVFVRKNVEQLAEHFGIVLNYNNLPKEKKND